jgi:hypothetical protein
MGGEGRKAGVGARSLSGPRFSIREYHHCTRLLSAALGFAPLIYYVPINSH